MSDDAWHDRWVKVFESDITHEKAWERWALRMSRGRITFRIDFSEFKRIGLQVRGYVKGQNIEQATRTWVYEQAEK